ncbi:cation transporter [Aquisalimonas sp. 2447]|uniref:cation diffusion facilitator family transporter n=1 Tax=Aquisalimonas sp. 2447 TaxID=2740807 RepID=UPI0014325EF6|nr:cation diffusion facilitator family transporter [Aquisalimonas sp. 2447]QIT55643.1 cation transporter [Aquisalimonas sp. 2447]
MSATGPATGDRHEVYAAKRHVTIVGALVNVLLAAGKIAAGVVGQSQALIVDGVHSLSDLVSDALVVWAARMASLDPDHNHPYGHGRFETAATVGVGALLLLVAGGFAYDAIVRLLRPELLGDPGLLALSVAVLSVVFKEGLYHYTHRVADDCCSDLLHANAWHHRSDALSSVVVIGGVLGAMAGLPWLDAVAALVVALMIGAVGMRLAWRSAQELVDTGLDPEEVRSIGELIDEVDGVQRHDDLRTRQMGNETLVDVRVRVPPDISISEGHRIGDAVLERVRGQLDHVADVFVHVDHEGPEAQQRSAELPLRPEAEASLRDAWADLLPGIAEAELVLHYSGGQLHVDVILARSAVAHAGAMPTVEALHHATGHLRFLGRIRLLQDLSEDG